MARRSRWQFALALQAGLIILPVAVLCSVALHFLHEDQAAIEQEARSRTSALAPELARWLAKRVAETAGGSEGAARTGTIAGREIVAPADLSAAPNPPDWVRELRLRHAALWEAAQRATFRGSDRAAAFNAWAALASVNEVPAAHAYLELNMALLGSSPAGVPGRALDLAHRYPDSLSDSGNPVAALALIRALSQSPRTTGLMAELRRNVREHPSYLTPALLEAVRGFDAATARELEELWAQQQLRVRGTRELLAGVTQQLPAGGVTAELWTPEGSEQYLALCQRADDQWKITLLEKGYLVQAAKAALQEKRSELPAYAGVSIEIGRRKLRLAGKRSGGVLASETAKLQIEGSHAAGLVLDLADADVLSAPYRSRVRLTQWLIFSSAATALLGLFTLWMSYRRQARVSEMKSNFVSSVSHELRAPIAGVRLLAESLESGRVSDPERQHRYYQLIVRECRRQSSLVENVLDFSRIEQEHKAYRLDAVDTAGLLRHTVALMEPNANERGVQLVLAELPLLETVYWDAAAIEQSMVNLIDNAIKHSPEGAEVRVEVEGVGALVRLWVVDRGGGIPPDERRRIFERFYRRGSELRRETAGIGIGLSIVQHAAEAHGGRVLLESVVGEGSRFGMELPVGERVAEAAGESREQPGAVQA